MSNACTAFKPKFQVKRLKWIENPPLKIKQQYQAKVPTSIGYAIDVYKKDGRIDAYLTLNSYKWHSLGDFTTIDEAKEAAQAHFEKLIMECIE